MIEIKSLEYKFTKDYHTVFEDMATLMFCAELGLTSGVNRRISQRAIESEPVVVGDRVYAYQAKYYDATTTLKSRKNALIKCIREAHSIGVTDLLLFINKDLPDTDYRTNQEYAYVQEIFNAAAKSDVTLDWWSLSRIQTSLAMDKFKNVGEIYFSDSDSSRVGYADFYRYVYNQFTSSRGKKLYGDMSLMDSYIEPSVSIAGSDISVRSYLESWLDSDDDPITVICGEPGHGKTSLCRKCMCDHYKNGWLSGKVSHVFSFSLNPANTKASPNEPINLYTLLSWGDNRTNEAHMVDERDCSDALIFLDGFDELLEWRPDLSLKSFIQNEVIPFQEETNSHIVVTSRSMAVDGQATAYILSDGTQVPIHRLRPITRTQQLAWIRLYTEHMRKSSPDKAAELEDYYVRYQALPDDKNINMLLGVPIIFRMIVAAGYVPSGDQSFTDIYDMLFTITWSRHKRKNSSDEDGRQLRRKLQNHALAIYLDDTFTAEVDTMSRSAWMFSFYTTHEGKKRVGFLHRSFYQYFLAGEILSWYTDYAGSRNEDNFRKSLAYLSRSFLDKNTLQYIKELYGKISDDLTDAFSKSYAILAETDGLLPTSHIENSPKLQSYSPLYKGGNCYKNVVSINSNCGFPTSKDVLGDTALRIYYMPYSMLQKADLNQAVLFQSNYRSADLSHANLHEARLASTNFHKTNLREADLSFAQLMEANLSSADLRGANLQNAYVSDANLVKADCSNAILTNADLRAANLRLAILDNAHLDNADLRHSDLQAAHLHAADLRNADLRAANLTYADLSEADLTGARLDNIILDPQNVQYLQTLGYKV